MNKTRKIISYKNLPPPVKEAVKQTYPMGYDDYIISVNKSNTGESYYVIPLELDDTTYLIKVKRKFKGNKVKKGRKWTDELPDLNDSGSADYDVSIHDEASFEFDE